MPDSRGNGRGSKLSWQLRRARYQVRHCDELCAKRPDKAEIYRRRYAEATALLVAHALSKLDPNDSRANVRDAERQSRWNEGKGIPAQ